MVAISSILVFSIVVGTINLFVVPRGLIRISKEKICICFVSKFLFFFVKWELLNRIISCNCILIPKLSKLLLRDIFFYVCDRPLVILFVHPSIFPSDLKSDIFPFKVSIYSNLLHNACRCRVGVSNFDFGPWVKSRQNFDYWKVQENVKYFWLPDDNFFLSLKNVLILINTSVHLKILV